MSIFLSKGGLVFLVGVHSLLDELEDYRFEVKMIYRRRLDFASELDVILLVLFEDQPAEIGLGRLVLGLDLLVHLLETVDDKPEDLLLLRVEDIFLGNHEIVAGLQRVDDLLHVFCQKEAEDWGEFVLRNFESLD